MDKWNIKRHATLVPAVLSISSLIYCLATAGKVPIRVTLTTPVLEIMVEVNPSKPPSRFNFLQDVAGVLIAADG